MQVPDVHVDAAGELLGGDDVGVVVTAAAELPGKKADVRLNSLERGMQFCAGLGGPVLRNQILAPSQDDTSTSPPEPLSEEWIQPVLRAEPSDPSDPNETPICTSKEAQALKSIVMGLNNEPQPAEAYEDFPEGKDDQEFLAQGLKDAIKIGLASNSSTQQLLTNRCDGKIEGAAYQLLAMILDAQKGKLHICFRRDEYTYEDADIHPNFYFRIGAVCDLLRESTEACVGLVTRLERQVMNPHHFREMATAETEAPGRLLDIYRIALSPNEELRKWRQRLEAQSARRDEDEE